MRGFNALEEELGALKNEGFPVPPGIEEAVQNYQRQAEESERLFLEEQANERQHAKQEDSVKAK